jgi:hypothetical protein
METSVRIETTKGDYENTFNRNITVDQLIKEVVSKLCFSTKSFVGYSLTIKGSGTKLKNDSTLYDYDLDGKNLIFHDIGIGD